MRVVCVFVGLQQETRAGNHTDANVQTKDGHLTARAFQTRTKQKALRLTALPSASLYTDVALLFRLTNGHFGAKATTRHNFAI